MKKQLLILVMTLLPMVASAQVFQMDGEAHGLTSELSTVAADYAWGAIDGAVDIYNAFETGHKLVDCKNNDYNKVVIDGNEILTKNGVQGNDNPKDADGTGVGISLNPPVAGAVIGLKALADGYVYIVAKLSTNKQYVVFEEGSPMGYKIAMENANVDGNVINVEFEGEGEYNYMNKETQYPDGLPWVIRKYTGNAEAESAGNGLGVFYFPVKAGCKYLAAGNGTRISWCGIYFSTEEAKQIFVANENGASLDFLNTTKPQCETPAINITNGVLEFTCATEDVNFVYDVTVPKDLQSGSKNKVVLAGDLTCQVSVYATKDGYQNSETVKKSVVLNYGKKGDVNQDGQVSITDAVSVVNIILNGGE